MVTPGSIGSNGEGSVLVALVVAGFPATETSRAPVDLCKVPYWYGLYSLSRQLSLVSGVRGPIVLGPLTLVATVKRVKVRGWLT